VTNTLGESDSVDTVISLIEPPPSVALDIKPTSCPNPLQVMGNGMLPVAILGTFEFDAAQIDVESVRLEGLPPLRWSIEDVATPYYPFSGREDAYDCSEEGPDGIVDLTLKFEAQAVVAALGELSEGDVLVLRLSGSLNDGSAFVGEDVVIIR
jgi:hypothetical protein